MWMSLSLLQKDLLSRFCWWKYRRHFYRSHSTPGGPWMVHTPGAETMKKRCYKGQLQYRDGDLAFLQVIEARCYETAEEMKRGKKKLCTMTVSEPSNCLRYVLVHTSLNSWQRKFPWHRSQSLGLCDAGSGQCNTILLQGTEPETGLVPALLHFGIDKPLLSLQKHIWNSYSTVKAFIQVYMKIQKLSSINQ